MVIMMIIMGNYGYIMAIVMVIIMVIMIIISPYLPENIPSGKLSHNELERSTMLLMGKSTNFLWPFSIGMLVYHRVCDVLSNHQVVSLVQ